MNLIVPSGLTCVLDLTVGPQTSLLDRAEPGNTAEAWLYIPFMSVDSLRSPGTVSIDCTSPNGSGDASMVKLIATEVSKSHVQT